MRDFDTFGVVVAGVGGQGAITIAQMILGAAWMSDLSAMQSEVHGMSQRGGEVSAHILFSKKPVSSPTIEAGNADLLIGMEPLETLRYLHYLKKEAHAVSSSVPLINMDNYPEPEKMLNLLRTTDGVLLLDTDALASELHFAQAGNIALLGAASNFMPLDTDIWEKTIRERFKSKGDKVVDKNVLAFNRGRELALK